MMMGDQIPHRRHALFTFASGFGLVGLANLLQASAEPSADPLAVRKPHHAPKAKRIIFLFMSGGPSHVDLFDPKPKLREFAGKPLPFEQPKLVRTKTVNCQPSPFKFAKHGQSGIEISELFPHLARHADDLCVLRGMVADNINHNGACLQMNTGEQAFSRPSMGSWLLYGLGTENRSLPGYVVISPSQPAQGAPLWSNSFLPAAYQGTLVSNLAKPIENLPGAGEDLNSQRRQLDALSKLNQIHQRGREADTLLAARIASFELAFRMQKEAPEAFGIDNETRIVRDMYGIGDPVTDIFGKQCLMARDSLNAACGWCRSPHADAKRSSSSCGTNGDLRKEPNAARDRWPSPACLRTSRHAISEDTLVVWGGEFGRTPTAEGTDGREHHPFGFTMWLAGGGVKKQATYGRTDEFGWHAIEDKVPSTTCATSSIRWGSTTKLIRHAGRDYRLTDVHGRVKSTP